MRLPHASDPRIGLYIIPQTPSIGATPLGAGARAALARQGDQPASRTGTCFTRNAGTVGVEPLRRFVPTPHAAVFATIYGDEHFRLQARRPPGDGTEINRPRDRPTPVMVVPKSE